MNTGSEHSTLNIQHSTAAAVKRSTLNVGRLAEASWVRLSFSFSLSSSSIVLDDGWPGGEGTGGQPVSVFETSRRKKKAGRDVRPEWLKDLAATYSRASYTGTTIGKAAFDGRVRNGNGSGHSFMTTKKLERTSGPPGVL